MDRREKLLFGLIPDHKTAVEIGALCRPFITRPAHQVLYVDHAGTEELRNKYRNDPGVTVEEIVEVDAVWGDQALAQAIGRKVDYVVASHVIEHVPDLITWLQELSSILNDGGEVRLIIPDKRFTFDYLRTPTRLSDVIYANVVKARFPQAHTVLDYVLNVVKLDGTQAWRGIVNPSLLERHHTLEDARGIARQILDSGTYHDVHCWVFTPRSFALLFVEMIDHGLTEFECINFFDTASNTNEFFVGLKATRDIQKARNSWLTLSIAAKDVQTEANYR